MCGIAGVVYRDGRRPEERMLRRMAWALRHRGPDGSGVFRDQSVGLVHTRLSILDLSNAGSQPMSLPDGSLTIVFNGEVYNFIELRTELEELGACFSSHSDTEVILWAYRYWGPSCFARFNGMWALAIWDNCRNELVLSRDRFGVKPLYYVDRSDVLLFASEGKAFDVTGEVRLQPDERWLHQYVTVGYVDTGEETFFEGVKIFPKACYAVISGREIKPTPYWTFDPERFRSSYDYNDPVGQFRALFVDAVRLRLRSDVPVGSALSGGLDSSAVVGVAAQHLPAGVRMHTFSSIYRHPEYSEEAFVRDVVQHVHADPHYLYPTPDEAMAFSQIGVYAMEKPCAGPTLISQLNVMREAHRHVKVLLDGQGSDEYLAGYHPFLPYYLNSLWRRLLEKPSLRGRLDFWRAMFSVAGTEVTNPFAWHALRNLQGQHPSSRSLRLMRRALPGAPPPPPALLSAMPPLIDSAFEQRMRGRELQPIMFDQPFPDELDNILYAQFFHQSIPSILMTEDANSMAFSVEARLPFMDYRMVEFMFGLDMQWKVSGWRTKHIQRKALGRFLPRSVRERKDKKGYPTPYADWIRGPIKDEVGDILFSRRAAEREVINPDAIAWLWQTHQSGAIDVSWLIYKALSIELWHQTFIDRTLYPVQMNERVQSQRDAARFALETATDV